MISRKVKSLLCPIVAVVVAFSLVACGGSKTADGKTDGTAAQNSTTKAADQTNAPKEVVKLQVLGLTTSSSGDFTGWAADYLREKVGIELELLPCGDQGEQKLQVYMASGELPDIVGFKSYKQVQDAAAANLLVNLDEHMDKLPNAAKNAATALQFVRDQASNGTGKAFTIPSAIGPSNQYVDPNYGIYLRWDLYKKLGMPEIKTVEDYLPILKKMVELEPKNADGQKVYGMSLWKDWDSTDMFLGTQTSPLYGISDHDLLGGYPFAEYNFVTNELKSILDNDSQYVRTLKLYNEAYKMGLMDPDSLTQTFDAARAKFDAGRVLFAQNSWIGSGYSIRTHTDADSPTGFAAVFPADFKGLISGDNPIGNSWCNSIGAATKHLDACLSFIDALYNIDHLMELYDGPKGVMWDLDSNNVPYVTDQGWDIYDNNKELPAGGKSWYDLMNMFGLNISVVNPAFNYPISVQTWPKTEAKKSTKLMDDWTATVGSKNAISLMKDKNTYTEIPLWVSLIPPMDSSLQSEVSQIGDIVKINSWAMVFEKDPAKFDKNLKDMQDKAKTIGIDKIFDYTKKSIKTAQDLASKYK